MIFDSAGLGLLILSLILVVGINALVLIALVPGRHKRVTRH